MEFNFPLKNLAKEPNRESVRKVLIVRLPCNPIFPIGPIYLADHIHKCFPEIEPQFIDLAIVPLNEVSKYLKRKIDQFRPHLIVYSWRDIKYTHQLTEEAETLCRTHLKFFTRIIFLKKLEVLGEV